MKRWKIAALVILPLFLIMAIILYYPHDTDPSVLIYLQSLETNSSGDITATLAITNQTNQKVGFGYGVQIKVGDSWAHTNGDLRQFQTFLDDDPIIQPHKRRLVSTARPSTSDTWRAVAICWKPHGQSASPGQTFKFYSEEITR